MTYSSYTRSNCVINYFCLLSFALVLMSNIILLPRINKTSVVEVRENITGNVCFATFLVQLRMTKHRFCGLLGSDVLP